MPRDRYSDPVPIDSDKPTILAMPRKLCRRYNDPGHAHFLTFSCYHRLPLLSKDRTRRWLIEAIQAARDPTGFDLWAYVIMPEHVHVLVAPRDESARVELFLAQAKRPVARQAIYHLKATAPDFLARLTVIRPDGGAHRHFWQAGGGYDHNVTDPRTVLKIIDYIHLNPVRRGLVEQPTDWIWSSARWYTGQIPVPIAMDATLPMIDS